MNVTRNIDLAATVLLAVAQQEAAVRDLTSRQLRGIEIAAAMALRPSGKRGGWKVASQSSDQEYYVRQGGCSCPDERACKHVYAVEYLELYARELARRLCLGEQRDGSIEQVVEWETRYVALLTAAAEYQPPAEGFLLSFRLEAIGDDAVQAKRMCERRGQAFVPKRASHLHLERPWVARLLGLCPQYEFRREFLRGHKEYRDANNRGSRGVWVYYELPPGVYEVHELVSHDRQRRYFASVENLAMTEIEKTEVLQCLQT